jgi:mannose-6-phosphate isomerase
LRGRALIAQRWLAEDVLPFWWRHGYDRAAQCFHERLDPEGEPVAAPRRVRSQARQAYAYALAVLLKLPGRWEEGAAAGARVMLERALRGDGGTRHALSASGEGEDERRDLYDLACVLMALAECARALQRADLLQAAEDLLDWCERNWAHPAGGYAEGEITEAGVRRQNPHMHMLEALLVLYHASGKAAHLARARDVATLLVDKMLEPSHGALLEYFDESWRPLDGEKGQVVEPGHEFEWAWLLSRLHALGGGNFLGVANTLYAHAETHGVRKKTVFNEILVGGAPHETSSRLWPRTERMKAHLVYFERTGDERAAARACEAFDALWDFRSLKIPGSWRDRRDAGGGWIDKEAPSSSLYHVTLAVSELMRVAGVSAGSGACW